jgi:hypothetical protein
MHTGLQQMYKESFLLIIILVISSLSAVIIEAQALPTLTSLFNGLTVNTCEVVPTGTLIQPLITEQVVATSPPPLPSSFYGTVSVEGVNAPPGAEIRAWVNGVAVAADLVQWIDEISVYDITVPADHPETPTIEGGLNGDRVTFTIGDQRADQAGTWLSGSNQPLDLTFSAQGDAVLIYLPLFCR